MEAIKYGVRNDNNVAVYIERRIYELEMQYKIKNGFISVSDLTKLEKATMIHNGIDLEGGYVDI